MGLAENVVAQVENKLNLFEPNPDSDKISERNLSGYVALWVLLPTIALLCCCCNGCEHFEGGSTNAREETNEYTEMIAQE